MKVAGVNEEDSMDREKWREDGLLWRTLTEEQKKEAELHIIPQAHKAKTIVLIIR